MAIKINRGTPPKPKPKPTAADSVKARAIVNRNKAINASLEIVKGYKEQYPGKDPAKLAGVNAQISLPGRNQQQVDVARRMVRDTTMSSALGQVMRDKSNASAGLIIKRK